MAELSKKLDEMSYDGLLTDITPKTEVRGRTIRKESSTETTYPRGTVFAKSSVDNKLVILGSAAAQSETLTPDCILCDEITVGTSADVVATVYTAGCFDSEKVTVKSGYTMTAADLDALRKYNIVFKDAAAAN